VTSSKSSSCCANPNCFPATTSPQRKTWRSRAALGDKVFQQPVRIDVIDIDRYKREVGRIYLGERFINMEMVRDGFAWRYVTYDKPGEFTAAEADAREHRRGLWADPNPTPPWEWRKAKRQASRAR